ncbi:GTF2H3 (predicted) [Pycnogonum litorale]
MAACLSVDLKNSVEFKVNSISADKDSENSTGGDLLVIVADTNPSPRLVKERNFKLSKCLDAIMALGNSHLMMDINNKLSVIACHLTESRFLFPQPNENPDDDDDDQKIIQDSRYELFSQVDASIHTQVKDLILNANIQGVHTESVLAGALAMSLCYINRIREETMYQKNFKSRILVITGSSDSASQYMNLMNEFFTAQKLNVAINVCMLDKDSSLLQQGCDITGGQYLKIPNLDGLLQYLLWIFLPSTSMRQKLALPSSSHVDYRAACFCHRNLIDIGYVCSVCLSIFCSFSPICSTCQTAFKFMGPRPVMKTKKKKQKFAANSPSTFL